jgi:hypothetical protein
MYAAPGNFTSSSTECHSEHLELCAGQIDSKLNARSDSDTAIFIHDRFIRSHSSAECVCMTRRVTYPGVQGRLTTCETISRLYIWSDNTVRADRSHLYS